MSDQKEKPKKHDREETPFEGVLEQGARIDRALAVWKTLPWRRRGHAFAILLLIIFSLWVCAAGALWIKDQEIYRSPVVFAIAIAGAVFTLGWLLWEQRKYRPHPFAWKSVSSHLLVMILVIAGLVFIATLLPWRHMKLLQSWYSNELKKSGLPADLYDYQGQLESLTIKNSGLTNLDWLDSTSLTDLSIASRRLGSLNGLNSVPQLRSLDLDLRGASLNSLMGITMLHHLQTLTLRNFGRAKMPLTLDLGAFPELKKLDLDFERSSVSSLPELAPCDELQDLKLNLRATTRVLSLPDMSRLHRVHTATVFVDNSNVINLKPLAALDHLQSLTLSLDGTQLQLLQGWLSEVRDKPSLQSLTLVFVTPPNDEIPNLSGLANLVSVSVSVLGSRPPDRAVIRDMTYPNRLKGLTISIKGSEANRLPDVGNLSDLLNLSLDIEGSRLETLPAITSLRHLEGLAINVRNTAVRELPDFAQSPSPFPALRELNLFLANSQIHSLHGIEHLKNLQTLSLDIRGTQIDDLGSISHIDGLENLAVRLRWSQVNSLPKLELLKNLSTLKLELDEYWENEALPDLSHLPKLTSLTLVLVDSQIKNLASLEKIPNLTELYIEGHGSSLETLPDLMSLTNLRTVEADISHTKVNLNEASKLKAVQKLTLDSITFPSLGGLPKSVRKLEIVSGGK